jgi:hypothetical protein
MPLAGYSQTALQIGLRSRRSRPAGPSVANTAAHLRSNRKTHTTQTAKKKWLLIAPFCHTQAKKNGLLMNWTSHVRFEIQAQPAGNPPAAEF